MHETSLKKKQRMKRVTGSSVCIPRKANVEENLGFKVFHQLCFVLVRNKMQNWSEFLKSSFDEKLNERQLSCIRKVFPSYG